MSEPFIGEIRIFSGTFAPKDWAFCEGQILPIARNTALFSILGVTYGGDGKTTFALPDLRGRFPMSAGQGAGLSPRPLGDMGGATTATLNLAQIPLHNHTPQCNNGGGTSNAPANNIWAQARVGRQAQNAYAAQPGTSPALNSQVFADSGGNLPHNNMPPYLPVNFIIALVGVFPQRP